MAKNIYNVKDVMQGYYFWCDMFFNLMCDIVMFKGLPPSLPSYEIMNSLIWGGYAGIFEYSKIGLVTVGKGGSLSGVDMYYRPTTFTYSQPKLTGGTRTIGVDCVVLYPSRTDQIGRGGRGIWGKLLRRYARQMADIESTYNTAIIKARSIDRLEAKNDKSAEAIRQFYRKIEMGEMASIENTKADFFEYIVSLGTDKTGYNSIIDTMIKARRDILSNFYEEIGIQHRRDKTAEMTATEAGGEGKQPLLVNVVELVNLVNVGLQQMQIIFPKYGEVTATLNPLYNVEAMKPEPPPVVQAQTKGGNDNDDI